MRAGRLARSQYIYWLKNRNLAQVTNDQTAWPERTGARVYGILEGAPARQRIDRSRDLFERVHVDSRALKAAARLEHDDRSGC
jgi:hypothetical protein